MGSGFFRSLDVELVSVQREKKQTNGKQLRKNKNKQTEQQKSPKQNRAKLYTLRTYLRSLI